MKKVLILVSLFFLSCTFRSEIDRSVEGKIIGFDEVTTILGQQMTKIIWDERKPPANEFSEPSDGYSEWWVYPTEKIPREYIGRILKRTVMMKYRLVSMSYEGKPIVYIMDIGFK